MEILMLLTRGVTDEFLEPLQPSQGSLGNEQFLSTNLLDSCSIWEERAESFWDHVCAERVYRRDGAGRESYFLDQSRSLGTRSEDNSFGTRGQGQDRPREMLPALGLGSLT